MSSMDRIPAFGTMAAAKDGTRRTVLVGLARAFLGPGNGARGQDH